MLNIFPNLNFYGTISNGHFKSCTGILITAARQQVFSSQTLQCNLYYINTVKTSMLFIAGVLID